MASEPHAEQLLKVGSRVIKNPKTWKPNRFDSWGRGIGVGVVVEAPFSLDDVNTVDVIWPAGRCFEDIDGLILTEEYPCGVPT